ncbi:cytochrome D1 domain-containing protein [uncultured Castellaniella sp.]|uniref:cytochrome D1 domain-containing protein n=1 Tax=uncultured Castellaniella sp. TaxID=647907 RepID=UPI00260F3EB1|nr:cytochrome D1 domain-containing protein [uncultured Castellaniella sp.]
MASNNHLQTSSIHSRRSAYRCALVVALCAAASCAQAATASDLFPQPVYVTVTKANAVEEMATSRTMDGLPTAHYDAISADGTLLLTSSRDQTEAYLTDARSGKKLASYEIGKVPQGVAISPDGRWGMAVAAGENTVSIIDLKTRKRVKTIIVGKTPHNVRFTHDSRIAYVTLQGGTGVAVVDMASLKKVDEIPVPGVKGPHNLDLSPDEKTLWVRDFVGKVAAVDIASRKVEAVIPVGRGHGGIDVTPGGRYVVTGAIADHLVDVIDPKTLKVVKRIDVGQGPHGVRASADGRWIYASVTGTNRIAVIDANTLTVARQVPTSGEVPFWLSVLGND